MRVTVSVWHTTPDTSAFSCAPVRPALLFPFWISTDAGPSVRFSYRIGCQGLELDQSGRLKRVRSTPQTPNRTKKRRSKPLSHGSCNGSDQLPQSKSVLPNLGEPQRATYMIISDPVALWISAKRIALLWLRQLIKCNASWTEKTKIWPSVIHVSLVVFLSDAS